MKVGDLVKLHPSRRLTGRYAGCSALIIGRDKHDQYKLMVRGRVRNFHITQIINVISVGDLVRPNFFSDKSRARLVTWTDGTWIKLLDPEQAGALLARNYKVVN